MRILLPDCIPLLVEPVVVPLPLLPCLDVGVSHGLSLLLSLAGVLLRNSASGFLFLEFPLPELGVEVGVPGLAELELLLQDDVSPGLDRLVVSPPCITASCLKLHLSLVRDGLAESGELLLQTGVSPLLLCHGVPISIKLSDL